MPKRRAAVNDIIFELDGQDTESDSGGEGNPVPVARARGKRNRGAAVRAAAQRLASIKKAHAVDMDCVEVIDLESSGVIDLDSSDKESNRSKRTKQNDVQSTNLGLQGGEEVQISDKTDEGVLGSETDNFNFPDPNLTMNVIDSVESEENEENIIAGCQNRIPLLTVKFRDKRIAQHCKTELKEFLLTLLSSLQQNADVSDTDTDLELDIWSEDVNGSAEMDLESQPDETDESQNDSNLFFVDTNPDNETNVSFDIPQYCQSTAVLKDGSAESKSPPRATRSQCCFNCDGDHMLNQCPLPKNYGRINQARKAMVRVGRYHVEDEQKFGHLVAGRISGRLRHALGLKRDELPLHIYRMRLLGYPPGWLQEARIQHSGITMFDSQGQAIQDPDEEEGELCAPGSKDKFDIKKILDYPGFNVPPSSRYKEAAHKYGLPPLSERDSKMLMLASLAPNAMQAYKRKKLTLFPSAGNGDTSLQGGTADMELASDEEVEFPSVPPLPDEAPPHVPPPPPPPPPPPEDVTPPSPPAETSPTPPSENLPTSQQEQKCQSGSGRSSPSLTDLEEHKRLLLEALQCDAPESPNTSQSQSSSNTQPDTPKSTKTSSTDDKNNSTEVSDLLTPKETIQNVCTPNEKQNAVSTPSDKQLTPRIGVVKHSDYGTPVVNVASPYIKLPSDDKFAKDICDIINFENLPDSTGTYKKMSALLRKVKDEVTKIQDS